jgi:hypothetical protein
MSRNIIFVLMYHRHKLLYLIYLQISFISKVCVYGALENTFIENGLSFYCEKLG